MTLSLARTSLGAVLALAALAATTATACRGSDRPAGGASAEPAGSAPAPAPTAAPAPAPTAATAAPAAAAPGPVSRDYAADVEKICNVIHLAAAQDLTGPDRMYAVATWLAANLTTQEARELLARLQPLGGEEKARAFEAEAARAGLASCDLAGEWRAPG